MHSDAVFYLLVALPGLIGGLIEGIADRWLPYSAGFILLVGAGLLGMRGMHFFDSFPECCGPAYEARLFAEGFVKLNWMAAAVLYGLSRWLKKAHFS